MRNKIKKWLESSNGERKQSELKDLVNEANSISIGGFDFDKSGAITDAMMSNGISSVGSWDRPYFIIKYGPPGSGKSSAVVKHVMRNDLKMNEPRMKKLVQINIDGLVENYTDFNKEAKKISSYLGSKGLDGKQIQERIVDMYFARRNVMDYLNNSILFLALASGRDITMETTGRGVTWPINLVLFIQNKLPKYRIVLIYPWVDEKVLETRLIERNKKQERKVGIDYALDVARRALDNFPQLAMHCDDVFIVDNSGDEGTSATLLEQSGRSCIRDHRVKGEWPDMFKRSDRFSNYLKETCPALSFDREGKY